MARVNIVGFDQRLIACTGAGEMVIAYGCGSGDLLKQLRDKFVIRIGLGVSEQRLNEAAGNGTEGCELRKADLNEAFPLPSDCADAMIANQVIEHVIDPGHFASELYRILRRGGRYFVATPNIRYIKSILKLLTSGYGPRTSGGNTRDGAWDDGHLHYFTHRDLRELFIQTGFREVRSSALINLDDGGIIRRIMNHECSSWLIRELFSGNILLYGTK